jgi:hypothetical protein
MSEINDGDIKSTVLSWPFFGETILWLAGVNKYILAEELAGKVIQRIGEKEDIRSIIRFCADEFDTSLEHAEELVVEIQRHLNEYLQLEILPEKQWEGNCSVQSKRSVIASKKYYIINGITFFVEYETEEIAQLIHPKFEYLEVFMVEKPDHHFQVFNSGNKCSLCVDGLPAGSWDLEESHYLSGKFSMQILQKIYHQEENDWMAVFHAAGITNGKNCLMFLGDSGNGKSTLSVILMANGLEVLADDFLPVESTTGLVCHFPSALSVKNSAYELLFPKYPGLKNAAEYHNTALGKTFRYIPSSNNKLPKVSCIGLVFVKYKENTGFQIEKMTGEEAFQYLVPDSWISPTRENANRFVNWFTSLPYYRMTYSDNEKMVQTVKQMLNNDL